MQHHSDDTASVCATADIICGKWTILVIRDLADGRTRFCELERSLAGISPRTLSLRLRALEEQGIVERHTYPEVPPRVEYSLTDKGRALLPLEDMRRYGREWLGACESDSVARARRSGGLTAGTRPTRANPRAGESRPARRAEGVRARGGRPANGGAALRGRDRVRLGGGRRP